MSFNLEFLFPEIYTIVLGFCNKQTLIQYDLSFFNPYDRIAFHSKDNLSKDEVIVYFQNADKKVSHNNRHKYFLRNLKAYNYNNLKPCGWTFYRIQSKEETCYFISKSLNFI